MGAGEAAGVMPRARRSTNPRALRSAKAYDELRDAARRAGDRWPAPIPPPPGIALIRVAFPSSMTDEEFARSLGMPFLGVCS